MTKITKVKSCLRLSGNVKGRDLVVGDLHGHRSLFEQKLDELGFDPSCDRVFSVGDLIDGGPESLATLSLIDEPWFFAVLGNHELMLLNYLHCYASRLHSRRSFPMGGGEWINEAIAKRRTIVERLAEGLASLPVVIHVASETPFNVTHGDLHSIGSGKHKLLSDETISVHKADALTSSRHNFNEAMKSSLQGLRFAQHSVQISPTPLGKLPITYVGHSPSPHVTVHNSYVHIDQGVCARSSRQGLHTPPTLLDHHEFAFWLGGVATARGNVARHSVRQPRGTGAFSRHVAWA